MKVEVKSILPTINKIHREWRKGYAPQTITPDLSAKFTRMMNSQHGILIKIKGGPQFPMVYDIEITDEQKYMMFLLRYS